MISKTKLAPLCVHETKHKYRAKRARRLKFLLLFSRYSLRRLVGSTDTIMICTTKFVIGHEDDCDKF